MNDQQLIDALRLPKERRKAIKVLYKEFPKIKTNICSSGGTKEEAEEIFNDALILLIEKVEAKDFQLTSKLTTFFYGINRFLWMNALRKKQKTQHLEWKDTIIVTAEEIGYEDEKEDKLQLIEQALEFVTSKCKELFQRFYYKKEKMAAIAKTMGYSSVNSAKTQKYKCMEHLEKQVQEQLQNA